MSAYVNDHRPIFTVTCLAFRNRTARRKKNGAVDRILITDRHFGIDDQIQSNRLLTLDANQFKELYSKTGKVSKCEVSICRMNFKIIYESKPEFKLI